MWTLLYWNNGSWSSEAEESFAIKKAKPSGIFPLHHYRETSPELGEMPSHSSSQINSVRVTQVFGFEEGVMESCRGSALCSRTGVSVERLHHCESSASVAVEGSWERSSSSAPCGRLRDCEESPGVTIGQSATQLQQGNQNFRLPAPWEKHQGQ